MTGNPGAVGEQTEGAEPDDVPVGRRLWRGMINYNHAANVLGFEDGERDLLDAAMRRDGSKLFGGRAEAREIRAAVYRVIATTRDEGLRLRLRLGLKRLAEEMKAEREREKRRF